MKVLILTIFILYGLSLLFILLYSFVQLHLSYLYSRYKNRSVSNSNYEIADNELPFVTVQLPLFNELYVTRRLLDKVSEFDYPTDKFEIQVLDDSTDESLSIAEEKCMEISARGIEIYHLKRPQREGYKAGALQFGLERAKGELIAIFDADFLPEPDFLKKTVTFFRDPSIGMVQTRWGHLNENYSLFTRALAFHLNAHFSIEQGGRNSMNYFMNFNGTAGIWRKEAIYDAGGWEADTLTEDLDLSYRTQLKGWNFKFLQEVVAPAELPAVMSAIKSQQYRWTKGGAETARKHISKILSSKIPLDKKFHGVTHLLNSSIFIFVLCSAILSFPAIWIKNSFPEWKPYYITVSFFLIAFIILILFYVQSLELRNVSKLRKFIYFVSTFPLFLCFSMGLSLHNSVAVISGLCGKRTAFIRTPKFNIQSMSDSWKNKKYLNNKIEFITVLEGLLALYFMAALFYSIRIKDLGLFPFHLLLFLGFASVFGATVYQSLRIRFRK